MNVGDSISVSGYVTLEKFIAGRTLAEIEKILGYHPGRLAQGMALAVLVNLPNIQQFELAAYSNVAAHHFQMPTGLDVQKLKTMARSNWAILRPNRLVKVLPGLRHDPMMKPDIQYPPGQGAPQWVCSVALPARIAGVVSSYPNGLCAVQ